MKKCTHCGNELDNTAKFCGNCGGNEFESLETETKSEPFVEPSPYNANDEKLKHEIFLYGETYQKYKNWTIVAVILCCNGIIGIILLILEILTLNKINRAVTEAKGDQLYSFYRLKSKYITLIIISSILAFLWIIGIIQQIVNPTDYEEMISSILNN
ncbi:MAG: zinc-ribbon domain-containing protein [Bacillales bacterium]|jgi:predicted  nucleic acid-binding Zn-ribbon protein|nr:zinc-ribbon domain-containing protein [Bacillales bacterium]